ncbi:ATP-binding protein [Pseudonocardia sp. ICBG1293]|uniref:ATP-binding protein n=1 Tax=Pseudonocardia sp. ICBG1293 TaxID=2844382 RepID=UPI001CCDEE20|nr:ATP-binding protein [Pseudonocardia sp. ICBG1293]
MANQSPGPIGREDELAALAADGPGGVLAVLHGERGSGRTAVLDELAAAGCCAGRPVLTVRGAGPRPDWDLYGVVPLLDAVTGAFEELRATSELVGRTAALRRRCTPESYHGTHGRGALYAEIGRLLGSLGPSGLVLFDDVDRVPRPEHVTVAARAAGHRVVVTAGRPAVLAGTADVLVHAGPLDPHEVGRLVRRSLRARPDTTLLAALGRALGSLAGNPAAVLAAVDELRRSDRLVTVGRRVCLRAPRVTPMLPGDALAMTAVGEPGGVAEDLVLLVDGPARVRAGDVPLLAAATGRTARDTGRTLDRLVTDGVLEEQRGELVLRCPAVATTLRARCGTGWVRGLHAAVVHASDTLGSPIEPGVLADHVEAAGDALEPDPAWGKLLLMQAGEREGRAPQRAADLVRAAARHEHLPQDDEWTARLLLRAGDHSGVLALVTRLVEEGVDGDVELLGAAAGVAALSLHESAPPPVSEALADDRNPISALHLVRRWECGLGLRADELAAATKTLVTAAPGPDRRSLGHRAAESALLNRTSSELSRPCSARPTGAPRGAAISERSGLPPHSPPGGGGRPRTRHGPCSSSTAPTGLLPGRASSPRCSRWRLRPGPATNAWSRCGRSTSRTPRRPGTGPCTRRCGPPGSGPAEMRRPRSSRGTGSGARRPAERRTSAGGSC